MDKVTTIRFSADDLKILEKLRKKTGISADAQLVRAGLRALAEKNGVKF